MAFFIFESFSQGCFLNIFYGTELNRKSCTYNCCVLCLASQSCVALSDPMDCSLSGSSVHGISQARIQGLYFLLQGIFQHTPLAFPAWQTDSLPLHHLGSLICGYIQLIYFVVQQKLTQHCKANYTSIF